MSSIIATHNLTRFYGKATGVRDLVLDVRQGEIFGFLGPNGAGKTTTIRILLNLIRPSSGSATVFGMDSRRDYVAIHRRLGYIPGDAAFYNGMTGREFLDLLGSFRGSNSKKRLNDLLERFDLDLDRQTSAYSRGMKQKLALMQAFMSDPELLILDEPTLGLDPLMQHGFNELLIEEQSRGKTVFLSSHLLPEVERVCNRVGIIRDGELVTVEEVDNLKRKRVRHIDLFLTREISADELKISDAEIIEINGKLVRLRFSGKTPELLKQLCDLPIEDIVFPEASLEDTFMEYYGKNL
jgi:ABC-2 type transport system ATP-binding protein